MNGRILLLGVLTLIFNLGLGFNTNALAAVGGDVLTCRSTDGTVLISNRQLSYVYEHEAPLSDGQTLKIPQVESVEITMISSYQKEPKNMADELDKEIQNRRAHLIRNQETKVERLVAVVSDPVFYYKKEWSEGIDYGDFTFQTTLDIVELIYNSYLADVRERRESIAAICYYHYFSTCAACDSAF